VFDKMPVECSLMDCNDWRICHAWLWKEALQLFEQMQLSGTKPDAITFVGVLSACCHAGLVDDGWQYFDSMTSNYNITPTMEHYCCMVDLLGRAGHLDEKHKTLSTKCQ
jgi:pentatricopeptide repeat protein